MRGDCAPTGQTAGNCLNESIRALVRDHHYDGCRSRGRQRGAAPKTSRRRITCASSATARMRFGTPTRGTCSYRRRTWRPTFTGRKDSAARIVMAETRRPPTCVRRTHRSRFPQDRNSRRRPEILRPLPFRWRVHEEVPARCSARHRRQVLGAAFTARISEICRELSGRAPAAAPSETEIPAARHSPANAAAADGCTAPHATGRRDGRGRTGVRRAPAGTDGPAERRGTVDRSGRSAASADRRDRHCPEHRRMHRQRPSALRPGPQRRVTPGQLHLLPSGASDAAQLRSAVVREQPPTGRDLWRVPCRSTRRFAAQRACQGGRQERSGCRHAARLQQVPRQ